MAYVNMKVIMKNSIEVFQYYSGRIGKNIVNGPASGKTTERQLKWQDKKAARLLRFKLNQNFQKGDLWLTMTYPAQTAIEVEKARKDMSLFLVNMRRAYKKQGIAFKYIYVAGRSKRGMVHFHMVVNKFDLEYISDLWRRISSGRIHCEALYGIDYKKLADYLIKNTRETFYSQTKVYKKRFCESLNLEMPKIEKTISSARMWKKKPKALKGYVLDKSSIYDGHGWMDASGQWDSCRVRHYTMFRTDAVYKYCRGRRIYKLPDLPVDDIDDF